MVDDSLHFFCVRNHRWRFCAGVSMAAVALTYWPQGLLLFRYERMTIPFGQLWRLASAHLVHLNTPHLLLNLVGLLLICELLWNGLPLRHGIGLLASGAAGISGLLWWWHPEIAWYAGLSGVLHGLWAGCGLALCIGLANAVPDPDPTCAVNPAAGNAPSPCWTGIGALLLLFAKLILETLYGSSPELEKMIGAPVAGMAHVYGAVIGCAYVFVWHGSRLFAQRFSRRRDFD